MATKTSSERFGIHRLHAAHPEMRRLRRQGNIPSIHGNKHWPSADLLMDYLLSHPLPKRSRVLDAGCGWGLGGIFCAKQFNARVTALDADEAVFPYLQAHAELNGVKVHCLQEKFQKVKPEQLEKIDVLIASDVCFWEDLVKPLQKLIDRALENGVKRVVIADPERAPFFTLAEKCIKRHCAELLDWRSEKHPRVSGAILMIENA